MPSFDPVHALCRGLEVLRVVNDREGATIAQIHQATGLHKSTVLRMLETLIHDGYVARRSDGPHYVPTGKCLQLASGLERSQRLVTLAAPIVGEFRKSVGWPSDLALFDQDAMVIVATNREFGVLSLNRKIGARVPMLGSSLGLAYLAFCPEAERDAILDRLAHSDSLWDRQARRRPAVLAALAAIRRKGYATSDPDYRKQVYQDAVIGLSVPVRSGLDKAAGVAATLNIIYLSGSLTLAEGVKKYLPRLTRAAAEITQAIVREFGAREFGG
jgi:IclR family mhp operon transcriptional activator